MSASLASSSAELSASQQSNAELNEGLTGLQAEFESFTADSAAQESAAGEHSAARDAALESRLADLQTALETEHAERSKGGA